MTLIQTAHTHNNDYLNEDNNLEELHDERREPLVGRRGQRAVRRSRRLRRMPRRAGGMCGSSASAIDSIRGLPQGSSLFLSAHRGKSSGIAAPAEMTDVLPGV